MLACQDVTPFNVVGFLAVLTSHSVCRFEFLDARISFGRAIDPFGHKLRSWNVYSDHQRK